jgi:uncharacterized protein YkvS
MSKEELPSINDYLEGSDLPSYKDFLEKKEELPSVEEYISESNQNIIEEETQTIENVDGESFLEVIDVVKAPEWSELVRLVNDVRKDIPKIPEIRYYDEQLEEICDKISQIQQDFVKSDKIDVLNVQNEEFEGKLSEIEAKIPTVKYYDHDINVIYDKITDIKEEINNLPEVKYYEEDLKSLKLRIEQVNQDIPTFPDWVQKVQEVPDFSWIGKTFSIIDDDFNKVQGHLDLIKEKIDREVNIINESIEVKEFEFKVDLKNLNENLDLTNDRITQTKDKIYKEIKESSIRIWELRNTFKDDDKKLKKSILGEQNKLKQSLEKQIEKIDEQSVKADETILNFFTDLKETVDTLPKVKYYDEDISSIKGDISSLKSGLEELNELSSLIKKDQKILKENYLLNEPPSEKETAGNQTDALTPLDQKFATLDDLSNHYRLFINRITTQLSTMGGGGAGFIKDLDDVTFDGTDKQLLIYDSSTSKWVGIASTALGGGGGDADSASKLVLDVRNQNIGYGLTIGTPVYQVAYNSGQDRLDVEESRASNSITMPSKGVVSTDLANNTNGQIIVYGELEGVNTQAFDVGDELYVAPGGGLTNVRPTDPTHLVQKIAVVLKKSTANGAILVYGAGRTNDVPNNISIAGSITAVDGFFSGNVTVGGTITYEDVKNIDSIGIITARSGIDVLSNGVNVSGASTISTGIGTVHVGYGNTTLLVDGDARITGILTIGTASVTIDGNSNKISVGIVTITNSEVILGDNVTINASATGINSAPNVFYVAKDGDDANNGTSIDNAKLTIAGAIGVAQSGSVIKVLSGNYVENNPITLPAFVAVVGDDQRTVKVLPSNTTQDIFHVNKGCKLANMTFSGHLSPAAAVAFPSAGATNVGGGKWKGPYIQNCTSDTTTGTGIKVDGAKAVKTKSMNVDAFTQYNQGGVGVAVTNEGYAQLVSVFTICCNEAITVHKGGQADLANSNCSFGTFGLIANGVSDQQFTGIVTSSGAVGQDNIVVNVGAVTTRPYDGQVVYFDQLYKSIKSITITNGGSGYTSTPSVTITSPTGPNGEVASAFATLEGGVVTEIDIISSGSQYTSTPTITISAPDSGTTSTATAVMADTYYTINSATPIVSGITTLTLAENLLNTVGVTSTAYFFQQSKIIASSHTFEYIGSGNNITSATPKRGGVTIQANEVKSENGGRVIYTSTDQAGNFRIGDDFQINQATGTVSGRAFSKSLFSEMTPFILALS